MKRTFLAGWVLAACLLAKAQGYDRYYENLPVSMPVVQKPVIPDNTLRLSECGGVADGLTLNTEAFAKAVKTLSKQGGGHLVVDEGIWLTGPIQLRSNIDLHLEKNAVVVFSEDKAVALKTDPKTGQTEQRATPAITASKQTNISITGKGIIDGNGEWWRPVKRGKVSDVEWNQYKSMGGKVSDDGKLWYPFQLKHLADVADSPEAQEKLRAHLIRLTQCENVLIEGVTVQNSPRFHIVPQRCKNVIVDGVTVRCPWNAQNGDAIDIGNCRDVLIVNCTVDAGDDGICMKGGAGQSGFDNGPCENILIQDNTVFHAHGGFVIGSEFSGGMKKIVVRHNTFSGTDTGLRFKSAVGRGGKTGQIYISDIQMTDIKDQAVVFETTYWDNHVGAKAPADAQKKQEWVPDFQDIHINNVVCRGAATGLAAHGAPGMIHDISLKNCVFFYTKKGQDVDENCQISFDNVRFETW